MNPRRSFEGARCLVTGADSGTGRAIAEHLAREGASVLLTGRSLERLEATARGLIGQGVEAGSVLAVDADLGEFEGRGKVIHALASRFGALDLAVNPAGIGTDGASETNVVALDEMNRALRPLLALGDRPSLVNIGATAGFTESTRAEWSCLGIHVLLVDPGPTATGSDRDLADRAAARTLDAIRRASPELTLAREGRLRLLANRLVGLGPARRASPSASSRPTGTRPDHAPSSRLPRPHFGLRIPQSSRKGD